MRNIYFYTTLIHFVKRKEFWKYFIATQITVFGSLLTYYSIPLILYSWYQSGIILAIFEITSLSISISFGVILGIYLKNKNLKRMWITSASILGVTSFIVFLYLNVYTLFIQQVIATFFSLIIGISRGSILPKIIEREELSWANTTDYTGIVLIGIIAPFVAAFLLNYSIHIPFLIDSITFFGEAIIVCTIAVKEIFKGEKAKKVFWNALKFLKDMKLISHALMFFFILLLIGGGLKILNVAYFHRFSNYYLSYGIAMSFDALGMAAIMLPITFRFLKIEKPYTTIILSSFIYVAVFFLLGLFSQLFIALISFFILGIANGLISPQSMAVIQKYTPKEYMTQVIGIQKTLTSSAKFISIVLIGVVISFITPMLTFLILAVILFISILLFLPTIREESSFQRIKKDKGVIK